MAQKFNFMLYEMCLFQVYRESCLAQILQHVVDMAKMGKQSRESD